ncbi:phosphoserine aminotransferase [Branchiibius hedensis]|uniref:phosphoserine transaminase n=1 Tax=Branchiibius hedensis TaxID=672460 RepID=A0A2Y8ZSE2_9MICO|nr:phosphoserine transaminase [Branchiibius hedensis]PWJ26468.1 phosphoserine aminotransferase [Branchiibius hedensis]SSA35280.1 phosphoserine aminotransferase apoenzyme [Branchiibius hedensis]
MAELVIPQELRPVDGRFGSGPSKIRSAQLDYLVTIGQSVLGTSHRQAPVKALVAEIRERLATFFALPDGYEVILGMGGSTTFWDVAAFSLVRERAAHAVFGEFTAKFAAATGGAPWLTDPLIVQAPAGSVALLAPAEVDLYATAHNETSTGAASPIQRPADNGLFLVDATSAAAGMAIDVAQTDVYYFAPQKSLASDGGLWIALMSPAALERTAQLAASQRYIPASLSLQTAVENSRLEQTLNTPALATLALLLDQLRWLDSLGGLTGAAARTSESSGRLYAWADASAYADPFVSDPSLRSPVVGTIDFDEGIDAKALAAALRANGIVDTEPYRKLGRNQLRIGMYPAVDPEDVSALTACIDYVIDRL